MHVFEVLFADRLVDRSKDHVLIFAQLDICFDQRKNKPSTEVEGCLKCPAITYFHAFRHYHRLQELNGRVRNGNVCFLLHMVTGLFFITNECS